MGWGVIGRNKVIRRFFLCKIWVFGRFLEIKLEGKGGWKFSEVECYVEGFGNYLKGNWEVIFSFWGREWYLRGLK